MTGTAWVRQGRVGVVWARAVVWSALTGGCGPGHPAGMPGVVSPPAAARPAGDPSEPADTGGAAAGADTGQSSACVGRTVPGDHRNIQDAIDQAAPGETICVGPGHWRERLHIGAGGLRLVGVSGPDRTVLEGDGSGPVIEIEPGEELVELSGLGIRGGSDPLGAAVRARGTLLRLRDLVLRSNRAHASGASAGVLWLENCDTVAQSVWLLDNAATGSRVDGVGVSVQGGRLELRSSRIEGSQAAGPGEQRGLGLHARDASVVLDRVEIIGSIGAGGELVEGGAVWVSGGELDAQELVVRNTRVEGAQVRGGAVMVEGSRVLLRALDVDATTAIGRSMLSGGALWLGGSSGFLRDSRFTHTHAEGGREAEGGVLRVDADDGAGDDGAAAALALVNVVLQDNRTVARGEVTAPVHVTGRVGVRSLQVISSVVEAEDRVGAGALWIEGPVDDWLAVDLRDTWVVAPGAEVLAGALQVSAPDLIELRNVVLAGTHVEARRLVAGVGRFLAPRVSLAHLSVVGNGAEVDGDELVAGGLLVASEKGVLSAAEIADTAWDHPAPVVRFLGGEAEVVDLNVAESGRGLAVVPSSAHIEELTALDPRHRSRLGGAPAWDLRLSPDSPLVDAGSHIEGDPDGSAADLGAYGGPGAVAW